MLPTILALVALVPVLLFVWESMQQVVRGVTRAPPLARVWWQPVLGAAKAFGESPLTFLRWATRRFGHVFTVNLLVRHMTFLTGKDAAAFFYKARDDVLAFEPAVETMVENALGADLYEDEEWNAVTHPLLVGGFMRGERLDRYFRLAMREEIDKVLELWWERRDARGTDALSLFEETSRLVMYINVRCFLGEHMYQQHRDTLARLFYELEEAFDPLNMLMPNRPTAAARRFKEARRRLFAMIEDEVDRRRQHGNEGVAPPGEDEPIDYLSHVLEKKGEQFNAFTFARHLLSIVFAAHTNTAATLGWTLGHVARDAHLQNRIRQEVRDLRRDGDLSHERMRDLPLTRACVKETSRRYSLLISFRQVTRDGGVEFAGKVIPKDSIVVISPLLFFHDPDVFEDPETWQAERFLDDSVATSLESAFKFKHFGHGKHRCLGKLFAQTVINSCVALCTSKYDMELLTPMHKPDYSNAIGTPFSNPPIRFRLIAKAD